MKKVNLLLVFALLLVMSFGVAAPVSACENGCTPGYWKQPQHFDSWVGYEPGDYFDVAFGGGPHITLLEALSAKRQDFASGEEAALVRHAAAALLNANAVDGFWSQEKVIEKFNYAWGSSGRTETWHEKFEEANESGCPLN